MKKMINWAILHTKSRLFKFSTLIAMILLYLEIFHNSQISSFWQYVLGDAGRKIVESVIANPLFTNAITGAVIAGLAALKKW